MARVITLVLVLRHSIGNRSIVGLSLGLLLYVIGQRCGKSFFFQTRRVVKHNVLSVLLARKQKTQWHQKSKSLPGHVRNAQRKKPR